MVGLFAAVIIGGLVRASKKAPAVAGIGGQSGGQCRLGCRSGRVLPPQAQRIRIHGHRQGVAIARARLPNLQRPYGLLAKLRQPIEFDAIDGQPVDIIFVLLSPAAEEDGQIGALALVDWKLRSPENLVRLCGAKMHPSYIRRS
jgi:PTS system nitrogen regulatory IIA component